MKALFLALVATFAFAAPANADSTDHRPAWTHPSRSNARTEAPWFKKRVGIYPSVYRGKWYDAKYEGIRKCIVKRESNGYYGVENPTSTAAGAYQFLISTSNYVAREIGRPDLIGVPASRWTRWEQDKGFWRLWNHGVGRGHWAGGNYSCW